MVHLKPGTIPHDIEKVFTINVVTAPVLYIGVPSYTLFGMASTLHCVLLFHPRKIFGSHLDIEKLTTYIGPQNEVLYGVPDNKES